MNRHAYFILAFVCYTFSNLIHVYCFEISSQATVSQSKTDFPKGRWLSELFAQAERDFDMNVSSVGDECREDFRVFKLHLANQSAWAVRMHESSEWPSLGLFSGMTNHLGNWDECMMISSNSIKGKYCLVEGTYHFDKLISDRSKHEAVEWPDDELSVWEILKMYEQNPVRVNRTNLHWALCIPSSCNNVDLQISLNNTVYPIFEANDLSIEIEVSPGQCQAQTTRPYSIGFYIVSAFLLIIFLLVMISTDYELRSKNVNDKGAEFRTTSMKILESFSMVKNFKQLTNFSSNSDYGLIHATKCGLLLIIIYGHRRVYSLGYPNFNPERTEINFKKGFGYAELTHLTVVDVFFMLTGFLTCYLDLSSMTKHGLRFWFIAIVHRWLRLIPVFAVVLAFLIYVLPELSDGPLWDTKISQEIANCKASWWASLLAINNIVKTENQCLVISWYMSADLQLAVMGFTLLFLISINRVYGWIAIFIAFVTGGIATFTVAYVNRFHGLLPIYISFLQNPNASKEFTQFYTAFYTRIGPYLVGFVTALVTKHLKERKYRFSLVQIVIGMALTLLLGEGSQHVGFLNYEFKHKIDPVENSLFAATYRILFVLPFAYALCVYLTRKSLGSIPALLETVLENRLVAVSGRLTYSVFLVNTIVQLFHAASQRSVLSSSILLNRFWWVTSDIMWSYMIGLFIYLILESPMANISKMIRQSWLQQFKKEQLPHSAITNSTINNKENLVVKL